MRIVCFGEILIRLTALDGEFLLQTPQLRTHVGGAEANVAVSLARFGHDARLVSVVPENLLADAALGELRRHGVDTKHIVRGQGRMGLYFLTPGAGQRAAEITYDRAQSAFALGANQALDWRDTLEGADWLHVSGVTPALGAAAADSALRAMRTARALGVKVSYDANFRAKLWEARGDDPRPTLETLFAEADLTFAEARDVALLIGEPLQSQTTAAHIAFERFPNLQRIACTERKVISADHHELSAHMHTRAGHFHAQTRSVSGIIDRIGGGDAFAAGVLHGLATGYAEDSLLDFALAAACLKHYIRGDFNLATVNDVSFYLANPSSDVRR